MTKPVSIVKYKRREKSLMEKYGLSFIGNRSGNILKSVCDFGNLNSADFRVFPKKKFTALFFVKTAAWIVPEHPNKHGIKTFFRETSYDGAEKNFAYAFSL